MMGNLSAGSILSFSISTGIYIKDMPRLSKLAIWHPFVLHCLCWEDVEKTCPQKGGKEETFRWGGCSCAGSISPFTLIGEMNYIPAGTKHLQPEGKKQIKHKHKKTQSVPQYVESPYVVSWLWHWLCCSVGPLQRCYRPAGTCNRYCCPPDPWWALKFYSPLSWSHWLCPASASDPSTAAKNHTTNTQIIVCQLVFDLIRTTSTWN